MNQENNNQDKKKKTEEYSPGHWPHPEEDEIDLSELIAVLYHKRVFILLLTLAAVALGFIYLWLQPVKYKAVSILEMGQSKSLNGSTRLIEVANSAKGRLLSIAKILQNKPPFADKKLGFSLQELQFETQQNKSILEYSVQAFKNATALSFLDRMNKELIQDHNRSINMEKEKIKNKINSLKNELQTLNVQASATQNKLKILTREEDFLKEQIQKAKSKLSQLSKLRSQASNEPNNEPIGQLLFSNEILRIQANIDQIQQRLYSELPLERENLKVSLRNVEAKNDNLRDEISEAKLAQKNMIETSVLLEPKFSKNPVGKNKKMILAFSFAAGFFLAVFLAFVLEFWQKNKEKIKRSQATDS